MLNNITCKVCGNNETVNFVQEQQKIFCKICGQEVRQKEQKGNFCSKVVENCQEIKSNLRVESQTELSLFELRDEAYLLRDKEEYQKSFDCFEQASRRGDIVSQYNLALCFEQGKGTLKDTKKAVFWFKESASKGYYPAIITLKERYPNEVTSLEKNVTYKNQGSTQLSKIYKDVLPNVVKIECSSPSIASEVSEGTGFILNGEYVITNAHIVLQSTADGSVPYRQIIADFDDRVESSGIYMLQICTYNENEDIAVLKFKNSLPASLRTKKLYFGDSTKLCEGDQIMTIGNAKGYSLSLSNGVVAYHPKKSENFPEYSEILQMNLCSNGGNSGGPVFNMKGEVVGVTTFSPCIELNENEKLSNLNKISYSGISFAVTSKTIAEVLQKYNKEINDNE